MASPNHATIAAIDAAYEMNLHFSQTDIDYDAIIARADQP